MIEPSVKIPAPEPDQIRSDPTMRASLRDGMAQASTLGFGEAFISPLGVFLHASILQMGILGTLPQLVGAIGQGFGVWCIERFPNRRAIIQRGVAFNAATWLALATIPIFFSPGESSVLLAIAAAMLYFASTGFVTPIWSSLIGDIVPGEIRGRFFGLRNRLIGICTFLSLITAGKILSLAESYQQAALGFAAIFCLASCARFVSGWWVGKYTNPPYQFRSEHRFTFFQFLARAPWSNFARFVFFGATVNFGVAFAAPYFSVYMLRDLGFSYTKFTAFSALVTVTSFLMMQYWGKLSDQFGNKKILNICGVGICFSPAPWIISDNTFILALGQIYAGMVWSGYNLAAANYIYDAVTPPKLPRCAAYQALVNAVFFFAGSLAGGYTARHLDQLFSFFLISWRPSSPLVVVFFLSCVLRLVAISLFIRKFRELRNVEQIGNRALLFRIADIRPIAGATFDVVSSPWRSRRARKGRKLDKAPI